MKGVPDFEKCICCEENGCDEYQKLKKELADIIKTLEAAGSTTDDIAKEIKYIEDELDKLEEYCKEANVQYISDSINYIKKKIAALTITVKNFTSNLSANTSCGDKVCKKNYILKLSDCSCNCDIDCSIYTGEVNNYGSCQCSAYSDAAILYNLYKKQIPTLIKKMSLTVNIDCQDLLKEIYDFLEEVSAEKSNLENNFDTLDLEKESIIIKNLESELNEITKKCDDRISQGSNGCPTPCKGKNIIQTKSCKCYTSPNVVTYFEKLSIFVTIEYKIFTFKGKGSVTELAEFEKRANELRKLFYTVFDVFFNESFDEATILALIEEIVKTTDDLVNDFNDWVSKNNVSSKCMLASCEKADQIKNMNNKICLCVTIIDWDKLPGILDALPDLKAEIDDLQVNEKAKNALLANYGLIKDGISELQKYVEEYAKNLDISYVQARCFELNTWYAKLIADVEFIKTAKETTETCDAVCPNSRWVYNPDACSCSCDVKNCSAPDEQIDYYNCMCTANNGCTKTQAQCDNDDKKILDYTACICKAPPSK